MDMKAILKKAGFLALLLMAGCKQGVHPPTKEKYEAQVFSGFLGEARRNGDWKDAIATGKHAQIVFMEISMETNPENEIGMESHSFDQLIYIAEGWGRATLGEETHMVQAGDMILIPEGLEHNLVNINEHAPLRLVSIYTSPDIPKDARYRTKMDEKEHLSH